MARIMEMGRQPAVIPGRKEKAELARVMEDQRTTEVDRWEDEATRETMGAVASVQVVGRLIEEEAMARQEDEVEQEAMGAVTPA